MHNFGEKRWGDGIIDDIRSQREPNTRVVGDFTKSVSVPPIVAKMHEILSTGSRSKDWDHYFNTNVDNIATSIKQSLDGLKTTSKDWKRQRLQTRFFETGDNFYLGMEFNREYVVWKKDIADEWKQGTGKDSEKDALQIQSRIDRLWFEAAFAIIKQGDVSSMNTSTLPIFPLFLHSIDPFHALSRFIIQVEKILFPKSISSTRYRR